MHDEELMQLMMKMKLKLKLWIMNNWFGVPLFEGLKSAASPSRAAISLPQAVCGIGGGSRCPAHPYP